MRVVFLLGFIMALVVPSATVLAQPRVLIDTDFGRADEPVKPERNAVDRITGMIAPPWSDNSGWAKVSVDYRPAEEEGRRFLRVSVSNLEDGRAQVMHPFPAKSDGGIYRLSVVARSPTRTRAEVGIRDTGPPYGFLWNHRLALGDGWQSQTIDFQLDAYDKPVGLFLLIHGTGTLDLARMKLERITRDELVAELKAKYPHGGPTNLVRVSRFPLGLPTGWHLGNDDSDGDEVRIAVEGMVTGPSAVWPPKVTAPGGMSLTSAPFAVPQPFDPHTASLYILGSGSGKFEVLADGKSIAFTSFDLKPESGGQRVAVTFTPQLLAKFHAIRLSGAGEFWLDALQVNTGNGATPYTSQMHHEVQLAVDSAARVQFDDEPARHVLSLLACGNAKHFLYTMHGHGTFGAGGEWRTLLTDEGSLHPAGAAQAALAWHLEDTRFVRVIEPAKDVFAYLFEATDGSRSVAVLAPRPAHAAYALPGGDDIERADLFGNPLPADAPLRTTLVYVTRRGAASADALERAIRTDK
jgi:hypothetical protein